jgi:tRNA(Ile)-lysidine synthase
MLKQFMEFIESQKLFEKDQKILLAVSGGIDSVTMTHLFHMAGFNFGIAHCNFQLRGKESDEDCQFVKDLALKFHKEFHTVNFDTENYAAKRKLSIQMAARDMRYEWFSKVAKEHKYDKIAVAHNKDDVVETILINLTRGTGLKGLTGIKPSHDKIVRPLLFAARNEINAFARAENIIFREDSSNNSLKYQRNIIRHKIIPLFREINPSFTDTVLHEAEILNSVYNIYQKKMTEFWSAITLKEDTKLVLSIPKIGSLGLTAADLYDLLNDYGFSYSDIRDIFDSMESQSGKRFYSNDYILLKDRNTFIIEKKAESEEDEVFFIEDSCTSINFPLKMGFERHKYTKEYTIPSTQETIAVDLDKLQFPLELRHWKPGDYFYPLGMKGKKKISDYFANEKIDRFEKDRIWILGSGEKILWIIGRKIDDRFKVTPDTENILTISIKY